MVKLIAYYKEPGDTEAFEKKYYEEHLPLANKMPGLIKTEVFKLKNLSGDSSKFYLQTEMFFENKDALNNAMSSDEGKEAARNLMSFAKDLVIMYRGEEIK